MNSLKSNNILSLTRYGPMKEKFFSWQMFYKCNYKCSYCFERKLTHYNYNYNELIKTAENIWKFYNIKYKFDWLSVIGGEVTLLEIDDFLNLFKNFQNEKNLTFELITNFFRPLEYFEKIFIFFQNIKEVLIKVSYHEEYNSLEIFWEKFENLIKISKKYKNAHTKIEFVINNKNVEKAIDYCKHFILLKHKYPNQKISLHLAEMFKYKKNWKLYYLFDSSKLIKKFPILHEYFTQERQYIVKQNNGIEVIDYPMNFLKSKNKILNCKGCLVTNVSFFLEDNKLKDFCEHTVCNDFINCDIKSLILKEKNICQQSICAELCVEMKNLKS